MNKFPFKTQYLIIINHFFLCAQQQQRQEEDKKNPTFNQFLYKREVICHKSVFTIGIFVTVQMESLSILVVEAVYVLDIHKLLENFSKSKRKLINFASANKQIFKNTYENICKNYMTSFP